jgi:uncharacterized membrane protein YeaQ/YmgE (transglycosylase-associated protein family)
MGGFFGWIIVGLAAGWIAGKLTDTERGLIGNLILGLVGGIVAGWLVDISISDDSGLIISIVVAAIVATVLVLIKGKILGRDTA